MKWQKKGLVFCPSGDFHIMRSHARIPIADHIGGSLFDIYFSSRDGSNRERIFKLIFDLEKMAVLQVINEPILGYGETLGAFDDNGVNPCCLVSVRGSKFLYYCGWNVHINIPFTCAIGLAKSDDGGRTFRKMFPGAVMDRDKFDPQFVAVNDVMIDEGLYRTWYLSCVKWVRQPDGLLKHYYNIKQAESDDGIDWRRSTDLAIDFKNEFEYAISTPRVIKDSPESYKMWYSYRAQEFIGYYRIGYAESSNGTNWTRLDERMSSFKPSLTGWDSEMVCYPFLFDYGGARFMLYNGNGYGKTGFGLAVMESAI